MNPIIKLSNVEKSYKMGDQSLRILHGISLEIQEGEFVAIMGPSGSGKSTLLHIMGALDSPTAGSVNLAGADLSGMLESDLARLRNSTIGFVFQNFFLLPYYSILENVGLPLLYAERKNEARPRAIQVLNSMGLSERFNHKPHELSGGERQRAAIARALINNPRLIFADEPTGSLDTNTGDLIMGLLETINRNGTTLVLITHDPRIAKRAHRIFHMSDGVILQ